MLLIADSSALITLSLCNALPFLQKLYSQLKIPSEVFKEVTHTDKEDVKMLKSFLKNKIVNVELNDYIYLDYSFGRGEIEAMLLYKKLNADILLIDDKRARKIAESNKINTIGSLGILLHAKEKGIIPEIKLLLNRILNSDIYITKKLYQSVLHLAREK